MWLSRFLFLLFLDFFLSEDGANPNSHHRQHGDSQTICFISLNNDVPRHFLLQNNLCQFIHIAIKNNQYPHHPITIAYSVFDLYCAILWGAFLTRLMRLVPLFGEPNRHSSKNREMTWEVALGGCSSAETHNNYVRADGRVRRHFWEEARQRWGAWRGVAPSNRSTIWRREIKQKKTHLGFRRPPTDNGPHNNQLKMVGVGEAI